MGIYNVVTAIKKMSMNIPIVGMSSFGDISLYDNKSTILYPYVNIDIISDKISNNSNSEYLFRIYVVDRNEPYIAYNKTELILDELMGKLQIDDYTTSFFTLTYQDQVNGVYSDIKYEDTIGLSCQYLEEGVFVTEEDIPNEKYIVSNNEEKFEGEQS